MNTRILDNNYIDLDYLIKNISLSFLMKKLISIDLNISYIYIMFYSYIDFKFSMIFSNHENLNQIS